MMKKFYMLLMLFVLAASLVIGVCAAPPVVVDEADLLTPQEEETLRVTLEEKAQQLQMDVVVVTVDSLGGKSARSYADDYYDHNGYSPDGILLLVSMGQREWYISTCGDAIHRITNAEVASIGDQFVSYLSSGDYMEAFLAYADCVSLYADEDDDSFSYEDRQSASETEDITGWLVCVGIGIVAGLVAVLVMKAQLKSVRSQKAAASYVVAGSFDLTHSNELYLYRNVSRVEKAQSSGTHRGSSGRSHGGGGGRF